jgi:hypothetical protein
MEEEVASTAHLRGERMRARIVPFIVLATLSGTACRSAIEIRLPAPVSAITETKYYDLEIPSDLEVRSADFSATAVSDVSGMNGNTGTTLGWRPFVKVFAVRRSTGEQVLLVYEDIEHHKRPVQIIRFRAGDSGERPTSDR